MWAVVEINKKQYLVEKGKVYLVERLKEEKKEIIFENVLLYVDNNKVKIGNPYLKDVKVKAEILGEEKGEKIIVYKFKRRKKYRKKQGHRQIYTRLKITEISSSFKDSKK
jgi:large subunit ribosomal protein L21